MKFIGDKLPIICPPFVEISSSNYPGFRFRVMCLMTIMFMDADHTDYYRLPECVVYVRCPHIASSLKLYAAA